MDTLIQLDRIVFQWINAGMSNPLFDFALPFFREKLFWMPLYLFVVVFIFQNFGKSGWWIVLGLACAAGVSDLTSSRLVKKNVQRLRPCRDPELSHAVILRAECGGGYSFTSSHAANHFAVAMFLGGLLGRFWRRARTFLLLWAGSIAFSQVYVGVHFPGDVLAGGLLGALIGWWTLETFRRLRLLPENMA